MSKLDIIRAWKDDEYRKSLSKEEQALLPENPAGQVELTSEELEDVDGGTTTAPCFGVSLSVTVTLNWCYSFYSGGTCRVGTWGCGSGC